MTSADHEVEPQTDTWSFKNEKRKFKRLMGAGVKSLHFSTEEELLFSFCVMFFFFSQASCHLEDDPEDE